MRKQPSIEQRPTDIVTVLSISPLPEDHQSLANIFEHSNWKLHQADRLSFAMDLLRARGIGTVLCECDLGTDSWTDLLREMATVAEPPPVIVTSRLADDRLWREALNAGAYDVLAKPFRGREVFHSVSLAWLNWRSRHGRESNTLAMKAAC